MDYPKVLVISNNSFSKTGSNGRTLGNFFSGWPKDRLAQFFIATDGPDFDVCDNYYCIEDKSALKAFMTFSVPSRTIYKDILLKNNKPMGLKKNPKTPLRMLIRNIIWTFCRWKNSLFLNWVDSFSPDIIVVMNSDSFFPLNIARYVSKQKHIPLVIFNTEGYYLFKRNYMWKGEFDTLFFPIYDRLYKHYFKKLMNEAKYVIYANSLLKNDYDAEFKCDSCVLYTGSAINYQKKDTINEIPIFSYLGYFGFRRYEVLIELSEILHEINPQYRLNVYGDASPDVVDIFNKAAYIEYKGFLPYDKVLDIMHQSDIIFHVENQSDDLKMNLKYGFSTKIADSISSGTLFCLYASPDIACSKYIIETRGALYADNASDLKQQLIRVLSNKDYRDQIIERGYALSRLNHDLKNNADKFREIIGKVVNSNNLN